MFTLSKSPSSVILAVVLAAVAAGYPVGDLDRNCKVNWTDIGILCDRWLDPTCVAPDCPADLDGVAGVSMPDYALLAGSWIQACPEAVHIKWLGHASFKIWQANNIIYVDPWKLKETAPDAGIVLVSHTHSDHYSPADIAKVSGPQTIFIAPPDVVAVRGYGQAIAPGQTVEVKGIRVTGVAAYNPAKQYHPKQNNWVGFIMQLGSTRIYYAGDTDLTDEMKAVSSIDVALLPVGGNYTMDGKEAAEATKYIKPDLAIPCHWGDIVGSIANAQDLAAMADCNVRIMAPGQTISSDGWLEDMPLVAHWKLDESEGAVAYDNAGGNSGLVKGGPPNWQPSAGRVDGAIELDGADDYVSTGPVLNPAAGAISIFAWVNGGAPGQVIVSQLGGRSWLCADQPGGRLMTELRVPGRFGYPLYSEAVITDGAWHRVGLVWDGAYRCLYVDGAEVAKDTRNSGGLESADGGLSIGAGNTPEPGSLYDGLIDDVRIYNRATAP